MHGIRVESRFGRAPDSKSGGRGFESLHPPLYGGCSSVNTIVFGAGE